MLSIGTLTVGQAGYYERQVAGGRDDYYSGKGEAPGQWAGRAAALLGLCGRVEAVEFKAMMSGRDPSDPEFERPLRESRGEVRTVGFDLTFSAPKSVSVLFAVAGEEVSDQLVGAHEAAVAAALEYVQREATKVRRGRGGVEVHVAEGGLLAAAYRHRMSRAKDPQLHTHVVCANVAQGPDGRWTALDGRHLFRHAKTAGFLYQAHLRTEVVARLDLEWGSVRKGAAELRAVEPEILREFSQRRHELLCAAEAAGVKELASGRGEHLAVVTRNAKSYGDDDREWRADVRARAAEHGLTAEAIDRVDTRRSRGPTVDLDQARRIGDALAGPAGLTDKANAFDDREVLQAYAAAAVQGATVTEIRALAGAFTERPDVLETVSGGLTTQDLVSCERRLIAAAIRRAGSDTAVLGVDQLARALEACDRPLNDEQQAAVRAVTQSGNGVDVIEALAGTGKTFTAGTLRQVYEDAGRRVVGLAPTGRAVRELAEDAGMRSLTMARAVLDLEEHGQGFAPGSVVVLDEAGMAATRQTERLLAAAERVGAKVIAIGDPGQLASVQAGGWMTEVAERVGGSQRLTEVWRQRDISERVALAQLHEGNPDEFLRWADDHQRLTVHCAEEEAPHAAAVAEWQAAAEQLGPAAAVMIARDNDTRARLNAAARELRRQHGRGLDEHDTTYGGLALAVGHRVICRRNDRLVDVDNGTRGTVRAAWPDRVVLETDARVVRDLPANYVAEHVEHAYCLTGHGMQGGTVEHATVLATPRELSAGWSYTALSRARAQTRLHIDGRTASTATAHEREQIALPDSKPTAERTDVLARTRQAMLTRDDEDLAITQLPTHAPAAGRADDSQLRRAQRPRSDHPERAADQAEPTVPTTTAPSQEAMRQLIALRAKVRAQRDVLPLRDLRDLDRLQLEREHIRGQGADTAARLKALPKARRKLGRSRDDHAQARGRLTAALTATGQHLAAIDQHITQLQHHVGPVEDLRQERDGFDTRITELDTQIAHHRDAIAEQQLADPPRWARDMLGDRPTVPRQAERYDHALRTVARYRIEYDVPESHPDIGPEPTNTQQHARYRQARDAADQAQRRLGLDTTLQRDQDPSLER
jgi:conjugative relaxase-like TrwC/TraI family protein